MKHEDEAKNLAIVRLRVIPAHVSFSIGKYGSFTRDQIIHEIEKNTEVGDVMVDLQMQFIRRMPKLAGFVAQYGS